LVASYGEGEVGGYHLAPALDCADAWVLVESVVYFNEVKNFGVGSKRMLVWHLEVCPAACAYKKLHLLVFLIWGIGFCTLMLFPKKTLGVGGGGLRLPKLRRRRTHGFGTTLEREYFCEPVFQPHLH